MQWVSNIFILLLSVILTSCIQDYEMDFSNADSRLSVVAELDPVNRVEVLVTLPKTPLDYGDYRIPNDAKVVMKEDGVLWDELEFISQDSLWNRGAYMSRKSIIPGKKYDIEVQYRDYPVVTASQTVPEDFTVEQYVHNVNAKNIFEKDRFKGIISFAPNSQEERFFAFRHYVVVYYNEEDEFGQMDLREKFIFFRQNDETKGFRDFRSFRVVSLKGTTQLDYQLNWNLEEIQSVSNIQNILMVTVVEELSPDAYLYRKTLINKNDDYYGELFKVYGNLQNGYGIFSSKVTQYIQTEIL